MKQSKKIAKLNSDIAQLEKTIAESQKRLAELKKEKTEVENLEIVSLIRNSSLSIEDIAAMIEEKTVKKSSENTIE